jgi:hypothetical protein
MMLNRFLERAFMKFLYFSLGLGVALILGPIAHHAYYVHQFVNIIPAILNSSGNVQFSELPQMYYAFADGTGLFLIAVSMFFGIKLSLAEERAKQAAKKA